MAIRHKRVKLIKADLERMLEKNEKRIQRIAEESFLIRQEIAKIEALPEQKPYVKPE